MKSSERRGSPKFPASPIFACVAFALCPPPLASAASLKQVTGFGNNPSDIGMYVYVPDKVQAHPPILVAMHWCHGTAQAFYTGTGFAADADKYGFIIIYPNAHSSDSCWDVHSTAALTHNGGSDPSGIVSMVKFAVKNYNGDSTRVYATGHSSGAMMTDVMLGSYPDVFKAGAAFAGVPFSCFEGTNSWNGACAGGTITKTAVAWGDAVRAAYPGYTGPRPKVQLWHGTGDATLSFVNFGEEIKQWTNVLGVSSTPTTTENNTPRSTWIRTRYDNGSNVEVEAIQETGQPHNLQIVADSAVTFFGLNKATTGIEAATGSRLPGTEIQVIRSFGPGATFHVTSSTGSVQIGLYDVHGTRLRSLADHQSTTGESTVDWDGKLGNRPASPGVYLVSVQVDGRPACSTRFAYLN
jgi:acetylxylan esterase